MSELLATYFDERPDLVAKVGDMTRQRWRYPPVAEPLIPEIVVTPHRGSDPAPDHRPRRRG